MIADYFILRRRELDVADLYRTNGRYAGTNAVAIAAFVVGVAPNVPGFLKVAGILHGPRGFFDELYVYAWFTGFLLAGVVYLAAMRAAARGPAPGPMRP